MNDYTNILNNIKRYVELSAEEEQAFADIVKPSRVKKRQFIVQPGFTCTSQTYVFQGAFRSYVIDADGNEHTVALAIDDWFISDVYSYIMQEPASMFVEALEDAIIHQIEYYDVEQLCNQYPVFERFFRIVAQKAFAYSQRRVLSNLAKSAEERYVEFSAAYPAMMQRIPQYVLASYLGMSAEFLSKIRSRLAKSG